MLPPRGVRPGMLYPGWRPAQAAHALPLRPRRLLNMRPTGVVPRNALRTRAQVSCPRGGSCNGPHPLRQGLYTSDCHLRQQKAGKASARRRLGTSRNPKLQRVAAAHARGRRAHHCLVKKLGRLLPPRSKTARACCTRPLGICPRSPMGNHKGMKASSPPAPGPAGVAEPEVHWEPGCCRSGVSLPELRPTLLGRPVDAAGENPAAQSACIRSSGGGSKGLSKSSSTGVSGPAGASKSSARHATLLEWNSSSVFLLRSAAFSARKLATSHSSSDGLEPQQEPPLMLRLELALGLRAPSAVSALHAAHWAPSSQHWAQRGGCCSGLETVAAGAGDASPRPWGCVHRRMRSLCRGEGSTASSGCSTASRAVAGAPASARQAMRCSRHRSTACSRCFIFFSFTEEPSSVR
mmetsp:Transcript_108720/g.350989  ORF Transcript_108720/g.350989 Transcript_108720/m.350989 type:complete len:407 (-) Transcript_108720:573-1793(-)